MSLVRISKILASTGLFAGLLALTAPEAVQAANKIEDAKKYTQMLKSGKSTKDKVTALKELGELGQIQKALVVDALPSMTAALKDKDAEVRGAAAAAVGKCDPEPSAVEALVDMLKNDKAESAKVAAAHGLAAAGPSAKSALGALRDISKNEDKKSKLGKAAKEAMRAISPKK